MALCDQSSNIWMPHIIEHVLKSMTYQQIFNKRAVDLTWHSICTKLINKGCIDMRNKFLEGFKHLDKIHREYKFYDADNKRYNTYYYQHLLDLTRSYLELIQNEYNLTLACVGRYFRNHDNVCLFDYRLLDHTEWLISRVYKYPWDQLGVNSSQFDPALDLCHSDMYRHLSKQCQLRFNFHVERPINNDVTVSGAKLIDILDTLLDREFCPVKKVHTQEYCRNTKLITYKATYSLYNAWFSRESLSKEDNSYHFNTFHYFLYLRMIRLVRYHNRFTLQIIHKDRMGRCEFWDDERSQSGILLSGKGDNNGYHYTYGCFNDKMKEIKFRQELSPPEIRLDLNVSLTSSFLLSSMNLQDYMRSNYRDLDYETKQLQMKLEVFNSYSLLHKTSEEWIIEIP